MVLEPDPARPGGAAGAARAVLVAACAAGGAAPVREFQQQLASGRVDHVVVTDRQIVAFLKSPAASGATRLATNRVESDVVALLGPLKLPYSREYDSGLVTQLLGWFLPMLLVMAVWYFLLRRTAGQAGMGGLLAVGKSHAKLLFERDTGVTFADVAGVDEAKAELQEVVEFLRDPKRYGRLVRTSPRAFCWWVRPARARRCWRVR